ncbi:sigma-70 region 4 domain-containing protein [Nocardioides sp. CF8]|uniref:SigE family RNA polymerase sigma factor n=1 Tax=Nocardioides sp. CF8 TaxID=110319 RepID=UPI0003302500|nr:SigE family RNA polymerase sigma factor [Nocardioides sp. CF8]EON22030.1 sigma-70 region 4 domain-containing protein [Nocardioides sp. CF8]
MPTFADTDTLTFEEYAAAAWPRLFRRAYLLAGNGADAEDLAQQTLIKVHGSWARVNRSDVPDAYVMRILANTFLSSKRPKRRLLELLVGDNAPEPASPLIAGPEDRMALWPHVCGLPPRQRAVIVLRYYEQLSEAEIADVLDCSRGNVKSTAHRALQNLRTALGQEEG